MARGQTPNWTQWALWGALGAWHLVLRRHAFGLPLIIDEGEYGYVAKVWSEGGLPYRDAFSQKPPFVFLFYRAAQALSGSLLAPRALAALFSLATMALLYLAVPRSWPRPARWAAPAAFAALSTLPVGDFAFPANTEVWLCFFTAAAALCLARLWEQDGGPWAWLCGLFCAAAFMTKQTAAWTALGFGVLSAWRTDGRLAPARAAAFAAGAVVVPAAWGLYFLWRGGLGEFYGAALSGNMRYAAVIGLSGGLLDHARWLLGTLLPLGLWGAWPACASALAGLWSARPGLDRPVETIAVVWLGTALCGALTGLFMFPHYFLQAAPPLALAAAAGIRRLDDSARLRRLAPAALAVLALWPALAFARFYFFMAQPAVGRALLYPNPLYEAAAVGAYLRSRSSPEDKLYVFGSEPQIYLYADRRCATRYASVYPLTLFPEDAAQVEAELAALRREPPRFMVYSTQPLSTLIASRLGLRFRDGIRELLAQRYRWTGQARLEARGGRLDFDDPSLAGRPPDWEAPDSLLIFEKAAGAGRSTR